MQAEEGGGEDLPLPAPVKPDVSLSLKAPPQSISA